MGLLHDGSERDAHADELRFLTMAVNETDRAIMVLNEDRRVCYINRAFTEMFGYTLPEIAGERPTDVLAGRNTDPATLKRTREKAWDSKKFSEEMLLYRKGGKELWVSCSINHVLDESGKVKNLVVVLADISETKQIQMVQRVVLEAVASGMSLPEVADLLCRLVEAVAPEVVCSMVLVDDDLHLHPLANPSLPAVYSVQIEGALAGENTGSCGTAIYRGESVCTTDIEVDPLWANYKQLVLPYGLRACWSSPIKMRDGRIAGSFALYYHEKRGPSPLHQELVAACLHLCMLAIERDEARLKIERLSRFDSLTGLPNQNSLYEMASDLLKKEKDDEIAFFALDIDRFKDVNTTLGHSTGESVLIETAYRLQKLAQPRGIVGRMAGDTFVIVMPRCGAARATMIAERALKVLQEPFDIPGIDLAISVSIGISIAEKNSSDPQILIEQAMTGMQQAKAAGRANYHFYRPEMNKLAQERLLLGAALRNAITHNSLHLYYQPQFRLSNRELVGVEALLRWKDEKLGEVPPGQFIPLAEEIGLIESIGLLSLRKACEQFAAWTREGVSMPAISVNISPLHFRDRSLAEVIAGLLKEYEIPASKLTIEITEGVMMDSGPEPLEVMMKLHEMGVGLSMDDFGTGFSSLAGLIRLPITELKLDRSFMTNFESDPGAQAVATAVIRIGQSLGMTVIAEGIETEEQARILSRLGCDAGQGYLYAKPMTADELKQWEIDKAIFRPA